MKSNRDPNKQLWWWNDQMEAPKKLWKQKRKRVIWGNYRRNPQFRKKSPGSKPFAALLLSIFSSFQTQQIRLVLHTSNTTQDVLPRHPLLQKKSLPNLLWPPWPNGLWFGWLGPLSVGLKSRTLLLLLLLLLMGLPKGSCIITIHYRLESRGVAGVGVANGNT